MQLGVTGAVGVVGVVMSIRRSGLGPGRWARRILNNGCCAYECVSQFVGCCVRVCARARVRARARVLACVRARAHVCRTGLEEAVGPEAAEDERPHQRRPAAAREGDAAQQAQDVDDLRGRGGGGGGSGGGGVNNQTRLCMMKVKNKIVGDAEGLDDL